MNDPFDLLRDQLVARRPAAARSLAAALVAGRASPRPRAGGTRRSRRVDAHDEAAAAATPTEPPHAGPRRPRPPRRRRPRPHARTPTAGARPARAAPAHGGPRRRRRAAIAAGAGARRPMRYVVYADLTAGRRAGAWASSIRSRQAVRRPRGCAPAGPPGTNLIAAGGLSDRGWRTRSSSRGRAASTSATAAGSSRAADPDVPPTGARRSPRPASRRLTLLDAAGRRPPDRPHAPDSPAPAHRARQPDAPAGRAVRDHRARPASGLRAPADEFPTALKLVEPAFLSCATTVIYDGERRYRAAVLLDADHPGALAPRASRHRPRFLSVRRVGAGVAGRSPAARARASASGARPAERQAAP